MVTTNRMLPTALLAALSSLAADVSLALEAAGKSTFPSDAEALDRDQGRYLGILRLLARRTEAPGEDLYDPALGLKVGVDR